MKCNERMLPEDGLDFEYRKPFIKTIFKYIRKNMEFYTYHNKVSILRIPLYIQAEMS